MMSIKERREKYAAMGKKHFTAEEIIHLMDMDELKMNANRGGVLAKKELKRREAIENLQPLIIDRDLDIGC